MEYYNVLVDIIQVIKYHDDKSLIDNSENYLKKLNNDYKIIKHDSLFKRYLYIYLYIYEKLNSEEFIDELNDATENLEIFIEYMKTNEIPDRLRDNELLFTVIFDYVYVYIRKQLYRDTKNDNIDDKTNDTNLNFKKIYDMILDIDLCKKHSNEYNNKLDSNKIDIKIKQHALTLYTEYFINSEQYIIDSFKIDEKVLEQEKIEEQKKREQKKREEQELEEQKKLKNYNICSDDFIYESLNELNTKFYDTTVVSKKFTQEYINELINYYNDDDIFMYQTKKNEINLDYIIDKKISVMLVTLRKVNDNFGHSVVLISEYISSEYTMYLFCPNGFYDLTYYNHQIDGIKKHILQNLKNVKFIHVSSIKNQKIFDDLLKYRDIPTENSDAAEKEELKKYRDIGYLDGPQGIISDLNIQFEKIATFYGTCHIWSIFFIEMYIKLKKLVNATPLNVFRYIIKKYDTPIKLTRLIEDYIIYFTNDKYDEIEKNKKLADKKISPCNKLSNEEYIKEYHYYIVPSDIENGNKSPVYDDVINKLFLKKNNIVKHEFALKYDDTIKYNEEITADILEKYIQQMNTIFKDYIYIIDNSETLYLPDLFNDKKYAIKRNDNGTIYLFYKVNRINYTTYIEVTQSAEEDLKIASLLANTKIKYVSSLAFPDTDIFPNFTKYDEYILSYILVDIIIEAYVIKKNTQLMTKKLLEVHDNKQAVFELFNSYVRQITSNM